MKHGSGGGVFDQAEAFLEEHKDCSGQMWQDVILPPAGDLCALKLTCVCGKAVILPCSRTEAAAVVETFRKAGIPITRSVVGQGGKAPVN